MRSSILDSGGASSNMYRARTDRQPGEYAVFVNLKFRSILVALACFAVAPSASAVTLEVAKKCEAMTARAFPPRIVGNPAAGSANGKAQAERDFFNKCVTNGGNVDDQSGKEAK
jgi:hypothetical protein